MTALLAEVLQVPTSLHIVHAQLCWLMIISGIAAFIALLFLTAPYGRYSRTGWGPMIDTRVAWLTQEIPSLLVTAGICWTAGPATFVAHPTSRRTVAAALFLAHYSYRSLLYPFRIQARKQMPFSIWLMSFTFCIWNGFLQGYGLGYVLDPDARITPLAAAGFAVQLAGLLGVIHADHVLVTLRKPGETGYKIPHGGFFRLVSAGNYGAEILEWTGYAVGAQTLAAAAFATFAFCNLAPRGASHHKWYLQKFDEYRALQRKAVIPFIW